MAEYPQRTSLVEVVFTDGEVKTYLISAGPSIAGHLSRESRDSGFLTLFNDRMSHSVPVAQVREFSIREITPEEAEEFWVTEVRVP